MSKSPYQILEEADRIENGCSAREYYRLPEKRRDKRLRHPVLWKLKAVALAVLLLAALVLLLLWSKLHIIWLVT